MDYKIYCDLDGVLVDFQKGYYKLTNVDLRGRYVPFTSKDWEPVDAQGPDFWNGLDWTNDGIILWNYIRRHKPIILSSPSRSQSSRAGKQMWVNRLRPHMDHLLLYPRHEKQKFAQEGNILIDDMEKTIIEWNALGGTGILHTSALNTIKELKKLGL